MSDDKKGPPAPDPELQGVEGTVPDTGVDSSIPREIGGPVGPEPTRYGDWERNGRCSDF
jgi:hypothetical protein